MKLRSCFSQGISGLCWGRSGFRIVDLTSHGKWHVFRARSQPPCTGKFAWLGNHPSLATFKSATVEVARARCHYCSPKLCLQFGPSTNLSKLYQHIEKDDCARITTLELLELAGCKMGLEIDFAVQKSEVAKF